MENLEKIMLGADAKVQKEALRRPWRLYLGFGYLLVGTSIFLYINR